MRRDIFLLIVILSLGLLFRLYISKFLLPLNPTAIILSFIFAILLFYFLRKVTNRTVALLTVLFYSINPWMPYLEAANLYPNIKFNLFEDPGLINFVNRFQGELREESFYTLGRFIENRYVFSALHIVFSILNQFSPTIYFTSQAKLLGFSFIPPIYFGFLIPFVFGLPAIFGYVKRYPYFLILLMLFVPSIMSKNSPDLSHLSLVSPIIYLTIALGYQKMFFLRNKADKFLIFLSLFLVLTQIIEVIIEISTLEPIRMVKL